VARTGIEPVTYRFSGGRSYRLSYLAVNAANKFKKLICPCHGAIYETVDGNVISGPTMKNLKKINVKIDGDNIVEVI